MKNYGVVIVVGLAAYALATVFAGALTAISLGIAPLTAAVFAGLGAFCAKAV